MTRTLLALLLMSAPLHLAHAAPAKKPAATKKVAAKKPAAKNPAAKKAEDLAAKLQAYLKDNKLESREVTIDRGGNKVTRVFVPVLDKVRDKFMDTFGEKSGAMVLRYGANDLEHSGIFFKKNNGISHDAFSGFRDKKGKARFFSPYDMTYGYGDHFKEPNGRYIVLNMGKDALTKVKGHWEKTEKPDDSKGGCMWWLLHAEVGKTSLAHYLGVSRAGASSNLSKKLLHAGNERVSIVGVGVASLAEFKAMSQADLLGPPPGGGAMEAVHD